MSARLIQILPVLAVLLTAAAPAAAQLPRQNPAACRGQPEIRPLQKLQAITPTGTVDFTVEVAVSPLQQEYGLMCRKTLGPHQGMLFQYKVPTETAFWMRNTLIPLDIIYIRPDGRVLSIARNAKPLDESPVPSGGVILGVLELAGGRAAQIGLLPGDKIVHPMFRKR